MTSEYGFDAVPRSQAKLLKGHNKESPYIPASDISVPDTPVVRAVVEYVKKELSPETYNHCVRVYYYGMMDFLSG
jgi:cyanamide hydratase